MEQLIEFGENQDYLWPVANPSETMLHDLSVISQSTKIAIDSNGTVIYNAGYGSGNIHLWSDVLTLLSITSKAIKATDTDRVLKALDEELRNCTSCLTLTKNICTNNIREGIKGIHCQISDSLSS